MRWISVLLLCLAASASAAQLAIQSAHVTISSEDKSQLLSESLSIESPLKSPLELGAKDILKFSFTVVEKSKKGEDGNAVQPHQTFLRFYDEVSGEEGIQPLRVSTSGKAKFELNMAKPPPSLPPTPAPSNGTHTLGKPNPLSVSIILGSFTHSPLRARLFDLVLPASQPAPSHPEEPSFHPLPEIKHTFRPDPSSPPQFISLVGAGVVLAPWVVLLGLLSAIPTKLPFLSSPSIFAFIALLGAFEGLLLWYWLALKLGEVLAYGAVLGIATAAAGNHALSVLGAVRTKV